MPQVKRKVAKPITAPRLLEAQVQQQIVEGLQAFGYDVLVTSARSVRKGTGADYGVPDLLVTHRHWPLGMLGIEVKRPGQAVKWSSPKQRELWEGGHTAVAKSLEEACFAIAFYERLCLLFDEALRGDLNHLGSTVPENHRAAILFKYRGGPR